MREIYFNDTIFPSTIDYIIGGFYTEDNQEIKYHTAASELRDKIRELIDDFVDREILAQSHDGKAVSEEQALVAVCQVVYNYLGVMVESPTMDTIIEDLMDSEQVQTWLLGVKFRFQQTNTININDTTKNKSFSLDSNAKLEAKYVAAEAATDETTFEQWIETLSTIV